MKTSGDCNFIIKDCRPTEFVTDPSDRFYDPPAFELSQNFISHVIHIQNSCHCSNTSEVPVACS